MLMEWEILSPQTILLCNSSVNIPERCSLLSLALEEKSLLSRWRKKLLHRFLIPLLVLLIRGRQRGEGGTHPPPLQPHPDARRGRKRKKTATARDASAEVIECGYKYLWREHRNRSGSSQQSPDCSRGFSFQGGEVSFWLGGHFFFQIIPLNIGKNSTQFEESLILRLSSNQAAAGVAAASQPSSRRPNLVIFPSNLVVCHIQWGFFNQIYWFWVTFGEFSLSNLVILPSNLVNFFSSNLTIFFAVPTSPGLRQAQSRNNYLGLGVPDLCYINSIGRWQKFYKLAATFVSMAFYWSCAQWPKKKVPNLWRQRSCSNTIRILFVTVLKQCLNCLESLAMHVSRGSPDEASGLPYDASAAPSTTVTCSLTPCVCPTAFCFGGPTNYCQHCQNQRHIWNIMVAFFACEHLKGAIYRNERLRYIYICWLPHAKDGAKWC